MRVEDYTSIVRGIAVVVREYVASSVAGLTERLAALEQRPGPRDGIDGKDGAAGIAGKDGAPGRDGIDGKDGASGVDGKEGPAGKDGRDGIDGKDGEPGQAGRDGVDGAAGRSVTVEDVRGLIDAEIERRMAASPQPRSVVGAVIDREHQLVLTYSDGSVNTLGVVVGQRGEPGTPGQDGRDGSAGEQGPAGRDGTVDNLKLTLVGERTLRWLYKDDTPVEGWEVRLPIPIVRSTYVRGREYEKDDVVTWDGSWWTAVRATSFVPGDGPPEKTGWNKSVHKGAQGKQGPKGDIGDRGPMGPQGIQGKQGY